MPRAPARAPGALTCLPSPGHQWETGDASAPGGLGRVGALRRNPGMGLNVFSPGGSAAAPASSLAAGPRGPALAIAASAPPGPPLRWARRRGRAGWGGRGAAGALTPLRRGWGASSGAGAGPQPEARRATRFAREAGKCGGALGRGPSWASEGESAEGGPGRRLCTQRLDSVELDN